MKRLLVWIFALAFSWGCGGENETYLPGYVEVPGAVSDADQNLKPIAGATDLMVQKAVAFRTKTGVGALDAQSAAAGKYAGVYVYSKSVEKYRSSPEKLAVRLALLGFTDVYLSTTNDALTGTDAEGRTWLRRFNARLTEYGARVHALRLSNTQSYVSDDPVYRDTDAIKQFNASAIVPAQRFAGASADFEPHVLAQGAADTPQNLSWYWDSDNGYGIGGANDKLLRKTIDLLSLGARELDGLPLSEAISYLYQPKVDDGSLEWGSVGDFLTPCDHVMVMAYNNKKETIWNRVSPVLNAASGLTARSVALCVKTSVNTYGDEGNTTTSLQPEGWNYLLSSLGYFTASAAGSRAWKGICFFEFEGLEQMWEWTGDKAP